MKMNIEGWLLKYDEVGYYGTRFAKGCFKNCDGQSVPMIFGSDWRSPFHEEDVVGHMTLQAKEEGIYTVGTIDIPEDAKPKSFTFTANQIKRNTDYMVTEGVIRTIGISHNDFPMSEVTKCDIIKRDGETVNEQNSQSE